MADRIQLPPGIKPGTRQAQEFHRDLIASLQQKLLDYQVQNPGLSKGTGFHEGKFVRAVPIDQARAAYAASLVGQPHSALAHLGFEGDEPITPEIAQAVSQMGPPPSEHAYQLDPAYEQMQEQYALARLAPVASQEAYNAAGGPAANAYLQTSKNPNISNFEKFRDRAANPAPILKAARKLRQAESGFGINTEQPSAYKSTLDSYLGPPPSAAPQMTTPAPPSPTPVAPPPANYGATA